MKRYSLFFVMLFVASALTLIGCNKKDEVTSSEEITIYGTVVDAATGAPIPNVQISMEKLYSSPEQQIEDMNNGGSAGTVGSSITGSDGSYEFLVSGIDRKFTYLVSTKANGYIPGEMYISFSNVQSGGKLQCDFQLWSGNWSDK